MSTMPHPPPIPLASEPTPQVSDAGDGLNIGGLTRVLRGIGALAIIASASVFLLQRWQAGNDIQRYLVLLAHTMMLPAAAFLCGLRIHEKKSARTLLALALTVMPVHFAVLGGLLYSRFSWDGVVNRVPAYASWVAPNAATALWTTGGAVIVLLPVMFVAFLALARVESRRLTLVFAACNALILLPCRTPDFVALLVTVVGVGLAVLEVRLWTRRSALRTFEGRCGRLLLWAPLALLVGRSLSLYAASILFSASLCGTVAFMLFVLTPRYLRDRNSRMVVQGLSALPAGAAWALVAHYCRSELALDYGVLLPLFAVPYALILCGMSYWSVGSGQDYRRVAAVVAMAGTGANIFLYPGVVASFCCLIVAVAGLSYGYVVKQKTIFFVGVGSALLALGYYVRYAISLYSLSRWGALAMFGIAVIVFASLLERKLDAFLARAASMRSELNSWEY